MRVLLVDDEGELISAMAERLSMRGIEADWVTSGDEAVEMARGQAYDVFVLDVKMPGKGGLEVMREIRAIRPEAAYVFLTGHGSAEDWQAGKRAGVRHYLAKPVKIDVLIAKMHEAAGPAQEE